jgi:predicted aspartyl protease
MSSAFDATEGLIVVPATVFGPNGSLAIRLALDTGATTTVISDHRLSLIGIEGNDSAPVDILTGSGADKALRAKVTRIVCLGMEKIVFPVLAYSLPKAVLVDGVLGLDYFEDCRLTIDFRENTIEIE